MHICLCVSWYFPGSVGGTETYVHSLAIFLKSKGHEVTVLKPGILDEPAYVYEDVSVKSFYPGNAFTKRMFIGLEASGLEDYISKLGEINPDVIHFHSLTGPAGISLFHIEKARQLVPKLFFTFHLPHLVCSASSNRQCNGVADPGICAACIYEQYGWPGPAAKIMGKFSNAIKNSKATILGKNRIFTLLGAAERVVLRRQQLSQLSNLCNKLICISPWFYKILQKNGIENNKVTIINQGYLEDEKINHKTFSPAGSTGPLRLVFLGRLEVIKGVTFLLSVLKKYDGKELVLDLYGPVKENYLRDLERYFKKENIRYNGSLDRNEIINTLQNYDAIIVPSIVNEMAPLVLEEALAAGIPAIASDVAGNAAFMDNGKNGWLFKSGDAKSLQSLLASLVKEKNLVTAKTMTLMPGRTIKDIGNEHLKLYMD